MWSRLQNLWPFVYAAHSHDWLTDWKLKSCYDAGGCCSIHSHKILTIQQGKPCYLGILCSPCSDPERIQAGTASLSYSDTKSDLGEMMLVHTSAKFPEFNPVDACQGFPMELTPGDKPSCIVKFFWECKGWVTQLGGICPYLNITFGLKRVNNERLWLLSGCLTEHMNRLFTNKTVRTYH